MYSQPIEDYPICQIMHFLLKTILLITRTFSNKYCPHKPMSKNIESIPPFSILMRINMIMMAKARCRAVCDKFQMQRILTRLTSPNIDNLKKLSKTSGSLNSNKASLWLYRIINKMPQMSSLSTTYLKFLSLSAKKHPNK